MATLKRQILCYSSILLWPKNYYRREQTAGISDGNKKVSQKDLEMAVCVCSRDI